MNVEIKAKLLQYFLAKNNIRGFTKIGLLVRMFLYSSVTAVILLPFYIRPCCGCHNLLWQVNCARHAEARQNLGATNRAQQAYHLENGVFTNSWEKLGVGIKTQTYNYNYRLAAPMGPVQTLNDPKESVPSFESIVSTGTAKNSSLKSYTGAVFAIKDKANKELLTIAAVCETNKPFPSPLPSTMPTLYNKEIRCPKGSIDLTKKPQQEPGK